MIHLQNEKSRRGFPGRLSVELSTSSRLTAPPCIWLETLGRIMAGHRARDRPYGAIAAKQATATRRKSGALRFAWSLTDDQHDFGKVTSAKEFVKIFFSITESRSVFSRTSRRSLPACLFGRRFCGRFIIAAGLPLGRHQALFTKISSRPNRLTGCRQPQRSRLPA